MRAKTLQGRIAQGTGHLRPDRHRALLNKSDRLDMSAAEWRYLRVALLGPEEADDPDAMVHRCDHSLLHVSKCEGLFPTEAAAKVGCNPLDFPEPFSVTAERARRLRCREPWRRGRTSSSELSLGVCPGDHSMNVFGVEAVVLAGVGHADPEDDADRMST
jgi:hypothetical protein